MRQIKSIFIVCCFFVLSVVNVLAQDILIPVPMDEKIRYGKLDNGLTYYIRHNENPKERAEFYIAQNVGAILEEDNQDGLAHFLEHMAFNGTENFPGKGIIDYFESIGVRFGSNINAYTSLDETVYNLSNVPTIREGIVDTALLVLHDWSGFIALEGDEIDAERGVIREEWRTGQSANRRMWKESNKLKYPGSQYAVRDVIGDTAVINNFDHQVLRDFYHKWYRPDLQAILVVGDVDVDRVEAKIKELFADIPRKENFGERPVFPILDNTEPIIAVVTDPEARATVFEINYKHTKLPDEFQLSVQGYLLQTLNSLISIMFGNRFDEITQQADAPFVSAYGDYSGLVKSKDAFTLLAVPHEGRELEGLQALLLEAENVNRFGFTNSELERAKADMMKRIEKAYNERNNLKNNDLVREYVRNYLYSEPIPGVEWEYESLKEMLQQLNIDIINEVVKSYIPDDNSNMIVAITAPEKPEVIIPTNEQILAAVDYVRTAELSPREEEDLNKPLVAEAPKAGKIKKTLVNESLGTTEWILKNGVKVIIKPTTFKQDEILLHAYSEGGMSKVDNTDDLISGLFAASVVQNNGLGDFSLIELQKAMAGKMAHAAPYIDNYEEGFYGNSSVKDFETMMQLIYLYFTDLRKDDNAFQAMMNMYRAALANREKDPHKVFSDSVEVTTADHNPRIVLINSNTIEEINQDKSIAIFKDRFDNPADFTFILTGNIDPKDEKTREIITTYLGGLKTKKGTEKYTDRDIRRPKGKVDNYFTKDMQVKKASNFILYSAEMPYNIENRVVMDAIGSILRMRYLDSIREKEGGSYGVGVAAQALRVPVEEALIMMQFDTDPEKQAKLIGIIHEEIDNIVKDGPRADDLQKVKENFLKEFAEDSEENNWWKDMIKVYYKEDMNLVDNYISVVNALTPELIQNTLKNIVDQGNVIEVVMMPGE